LDVDVQTIETAELPQSHYDCAIMRMVLEHVPSPIDCLMKLRDTLKQGAQLVLSLPNFDCFAARWFKEHAYSLHVPQHMNHFTRQTIGWALKTSGFRVDRVFGVKSRRDIIRSVELRAADRGLSAGTGPLAQKWFQRTFLKLWLTFAKMAGRSSRMVVYARKET